MLCDDTITMCEKLRDVIPEFDIVCAIPRGGLTPASIIASKFGRPLCTPDLLLDNKYWWTTSNNVEKPRGNNTEFNMNIPFKENYKILLVDDVSYNWFGMLHRTKMMLTEKHPDLTVYKIAPYCFERTKRNLDFYCKEISIEHWFEKDLLIRKRGTAALIYDMDGVLCDNCSSDIVSSDTKYSEWIVNVHPYMIPHYKIDYIITGRLEKYRKETEEWLNRNKVKYSNLIMQNANGRVNTDHALYKAQVINQLKKNDKLAHGTIMIESSIEQAKTIYKEADIQVIAIDTNVLIGATNIGYEYHPIFKGYRDNKEHPVKVSEKYLKPKEDRKSHGNWLFPNI